MLTCRDVIDVLAEYLDHALGPTASGELEAHLRDCEECVAYLNTYRKTRVVAAAAGRVEMPRDLKARLRAYLLAQLGKPV